MDGHISTEEGTKRELVRSMVKQSVDNYTGWTIASPKLSKYMSSAIFGRYKAKVIMAGGDTSVLDFGPRGKKAGVSSKTHVTKTQKEMS